MCIYSPDETEALKPRSGFPPRLYRNYILYTRSASVLRAPPRTGHGSRSSVQCNPSAALPVRYGCPHIKRREGCAQISLRTAGLNAGPRRSGRGRLLFGLAPKAPNARRIDHAVERSSAGPTPALQQSNPSSNASSMSSIREHKVGCGALGAGRAPSESVGEERG